MSTRWAKVHKGMFTHRTVHYRTQEDLLRDLHREFRFDLDPCPIGGSGGLEKSWAGRRVYCNPPYGRDVAKWLAKGLEARLAVFNLPARTDTAWWHEFFPKASQVRFVRGRLRFGGATFSAPFPSVLLIFRGKRP